MRIFFVLDETPFFHPEFIHNVIRKLTQSDEIVGAITVVEIPKSSNIEAYMRRNILRLRVSELAHLSFRRCKARILDQVYPLGNNQQFFSTSAALKHHGIQPLPVRFNVNSPSVLNKIVAASPDVIVSSNSLIFREDLLALPNLCCINRHSSLLPSYAGILPVLHAVSRGEKKVGVSINLMTSEIDGGAILAQREVSVSDPPNLWMLYRDCFRESVPALLEALDRVRENDLGNIAPERRPSYFSFPEHEDWVRFRQRGGRWI